MMTAPSGIDEQHTRRIELARMRTSMEHVDDLRRLYARAVQRLIVDGAPRVLDRLVRPVDAASERASATLNAWRAGACPEREVCHAHDELAGLMVRVILTAR